MNGKMPVSALQELMDSRKLPLPVYTEEGFGTSFKCTVHAGGITAVGFATSKKSAKHESAKNALAKLRTLTKPPPMVFQPHSPSKNYVGELNEFSSKRGVNYPEYECMTSTLNGEFYFSCAFLGEKTCGIGSNKKDAKQNAAANMLKLIENVDVSRYKIVPMKTVVNIEDKERIVSMFEKLSTTTSFNSSFSSDRIEADPLITFVETDRLEDLEFQVKQCGIRYNVTVMQTNPYLISLVIENTNLTFLGSGVTKNAALKKALTDLLKVKRSGCSLSADLISFI